MCRGKNSAQVCVDRQLIFFGLRAIRVVSQVNEKHRRAQHIIQKPGGRQTNAERRRSVFLFTFCYRYYLLTGSPVEQCVRGATSCFSRAMRFATIIEKIAMTSNTTTAATVPVAAGSR